MDISNNGNNNNSLTDDEIHSLYNKIKNNRTECDLLVSLFYCSATSTRRHSVCEPFPEKFKKGKSIKNFDEIDNIIKEIPCLSSISNIEIFKKLSSRTLLLLDFILNNLSFSVKQVEFKKFEKKTDYLVDILEHLKGAQLPTKIFKFKYDTSLKQKNAEFKQLKEQFGTLFGYHGSSNDSWNNIIKGRGFANQYISENCIFGHGFYFSSDSKVSHSFVKIGKWWERSEFGSKVGCLSACEIIDTDQTNRGVRVSPQSSPKSLQPQNYQYTSDDKALPDHYIISKIGGHIRVKYLLVFQDKQADLENIASSSNSVQVNNDNNNNNQQDNQDTNQNNQNNQNNNYLTRILNWRPRQNNLFLIIFIVYALILLLAGKIPQWFFSTNNNKKSFKSIVSKLEL